MLTIMDRITDKIGWEEKVFNKEITSKWRAELVNYDEDNDEAKNEKVEKDKAKNNGADEEYDQDKKKQKEQKMPQETKHEEVKNEPIDGWKSRGTTNRMVD